MEALHRSTLPLPLLLVTCTRSLHNVRLACATDLPGNVERVHRGSCSVVPKISNRACRLLAQSSIVQQYGRYCFVGKQASILFPQKEQIYCEVYFSLKGYLFENQCILSGEECLNENSKAGYYVIRIRMRRLRPNAKDRATNVNICKMQYIVQNKLVNS